MNGFKGFLVGIGLAVIASVVSFQVARSTVNCEGHLVPEALSF